MKNLNLYLKEIKKYPALSRDEEGELLGQAKKGNRAAINKLVRSHLKFVVRLARCYTNQGLPLDDLIGFGNLGLLEAVRGYEPKKNKAGAYNTFLSYAVWGIRCAMLRGVENQSSITTVSQYHRVRLRKIKKTESESEQIKGGRALGEQTSNYPADLPQKCAIQPAEIAASTAAPDQQVIERETKSQLSDAMRKLPQVTRDIILRRYGFCGSPQTLDDIASALHLSKTTVYRAYKTGLRQMREYAAELK